MLNIHLLFGSLVINCLVNTAGVMMVSGRRCRSTVCIFDFTKNRLTDRYFI